MLISGSCPPEPGKCPGKPLIALPDRPDGPPYRLFEMTFKIKSYTTIINGEETTVVIVSDMNFCNL